MREIRANGNLSRRHELRRCMGRKASPSPCLASQAVDSHASQGQSVGLPITCVMRISMASGPSARGLPTAPVGVMSTALGVASAP
jgi:hypothetical protein